MLIYDQRSNDAHCLGSVAAHVWRVCDGQTPVAQLPDALDLDATTVARALEELEACGLLDPAVSTGLTRREATARFAKIGAAAASAPLIYSIAAPTPALAVTEAMCNVLFPCSTSGSCNSANAGACFAAGCVCCHGTQPGGGTFSICTTTCSQVAGSPCVNGSQTAGCPPGVRSTGNCAAS
jgi:hypothetical protein